MVEVMFFAEMKIFNGRWTPVALQDEPATVKVGGQLHFKTSTSVGSEIRNVHEIDPSYIKAGLTLDQLADIYGKDGRFRSQAGAR